MLRGGTVAVGVAEVLAGRLSLVADHLVLALREPDVPLAPGGEAILTDAPGLDAALRTRLSPRSWPLIEPGAAALTATFARTPIRGGTLEAAIVTPGLEIEVAWRELGPPIVATGRVGAGPPWDSSTVLIEAGAWSARVNGRPIAGAAFPNDVWRSWFDRPLSSALVALAEVFREADS
jgi:hypothetical protein